MTQSLKSAIYNRQVLVTCHCIRDDESCRCIDRRTLKIGRTPVIDTAYLLQYSNVIKNSTKKLSKPQSEIRYSSLKCNKTGPSYQHHSSSPRIHQAAGPNSKIVAGASDGIRLNLNSDEHLQYFVENITARVLVFIRSEQFYTAT
jgi:hypothetical protein